MTAKAAILDIDGTLVDTNYHHAIAWYRAFREHDVELPSGRSTARSGWAATSSSPRSPASEVEGELGDEIRDAEQASTAS